MIAYFKQSVKYWLNFPSYKYNINEQYQQYFSKNITKTQTCFSKFYSLKNCIYKKYDNNIFEILIKNLKNIIYTTV